MTIETKYDIGDKVFFMLNLKPCKGVIDSINLTILRLKLPISPRIPPTSQVYEYIATYKVHKTTRDSALAHSLDGLVEDPISEDDLYSTAKEMRNTLFGKDSTEKYPLLEE